MAKKDFSKGIDRVFSPTVKDEGVQEPEEIREHGNVETKETTETKEPVIVSKDKRANEKKKDFANYNLQYPKELQKRIKRFCIENDGIDMKDVFIQGAILYLEQNKR